MNKLKDYYIYLVQWLKEWTIVRKGDYVLKTEYNKLQQELDDEEDTNMQREIELQKKNKILTERLKSKVLAMDTISKKIEELKKQKDSAIASLPKPIELKQVVRKHKYKPSINKEMHTIFNNFSKDIELQEDIWNFLNTLNVNRLKPSSRDNLVYTTTNKLIDYTEKNLKYKRDINNYGSMEFWLNPREAYRTFIAKDGDDEGDCEDVAIFINCCLQVALSHFGYTTDCVYMGMGRIGYNYGHMFVMYQKENGKFIKIETTYKPQTFEYDWRYNKELLNACYISDIVLFNEFGEFILKR